MKLFHLLLAMLLAVVLPASAARPITSGEDLMRHDGQIYRAADMAFPEAYGDVERWRQGRAAVSAVSQFGGAYWLVAQVRNDSAVADWAVAPGSVLFERAAIRVYGSDGSMQSLTSGYRADYQYALHYGQRIRIAPGASATIVARLDSPFYQAPPSLRLFTEAGYRHQSTLENSLILASLGALGALAVFNLFVHLMKPDRATLFYALYLLVFLLAWAQEFHLPAHLLGWHNLHWLYVPFFLLALPHTAFYVEFLQLRQHFPRLAKLSRINYVLPLLLLPSTVLALSYAPILATLAISIWLSLALLCGVVCLRAGVRQARYFVLASCALIVPATLILPSNFGLMAPPVYNPELLTLLGGTLDALLLAFALAHKLRLLVQDKELAMQQLNRSIIQAHTDHLTGIANRHAFDDQLARRHADAQGGREEGGLALLAGAWFSQLVGHLYPCEMCHWQRWPHYAALPFALLAFVVPQRSIAKALVVIAALLIAVSGAIGVAHAGVEYHWWEGFTACTQTVDLRGLGPDARLEALMHAPMVRCDTPQWTLIGISLAGFNAIFSLGGALLILWWMRKAR